MPRQITKNIFKHLKQGNTTLAMCWKLRLKSGNELGFTNHDNDIVFDNLRYVAKSGFTASTVSNKSNLSVDGMDIQGVLDHDIITKADLLSGIYDNAEIWVFLINYLRPGDGIVKLQRGHLGEVKLGQDVFIAEVRGLVQALNAKLGEVFSPNCRAKFCDQRCKLSVSEYTIENLYVSDVIDHKNFLFDICENTANKNDDVEDKDADIDTKRKYISINSDIFSNGSIKFINGLNCDLRVVLKYCRDFEIQTLLPLPNIVNVGDKFQLFAGCNKTFNMCSKFYNNAVNFRGEPHIPNRHDSLNN